MDPHLSTEVITGRAHMTPRDVLSPAKAGARVPQDYAAGRTGLQAKKDEQPANMAQSHVEKQRE